MNNYFHKMNKINFIDFIDVFSVDPQQIALNELFDIFHEQRYQYDISLLKRIITISYGPCFVFYQLIYVIYKHIIAGNQFEYHHNYVEVPIWK